MTAASTRWLRSASRVPQVSVPLRGYPVPRSRGSVGELSHAEPALRRASRWHCRRRPYTTSTALSSQPPELPPDQCLESHNEQPPNKQPIKQPPIETLAGPIKASLPLQCPGCGAFSQTNDNTIAGFYNLARHAVRNHLRPPKPRGLDAQAQAENDVVRELLKTMSPNEVQKLGLGKGLIAQEVPQGAPRPRAHAIAMKT